MVSSFLLSELTTDLYKSEMSVDAEWLYNCPASGYYAECSPEEERIYDLVLCSFMTGRLRVTYTSTIAPVDMKQLLKYIVKDRRLSVNIYEHLIDIEYSNYMPGVGYSYIVRVTDTKVLDDIAVYNKLCRLQVEHILDGVDKTWDDYTKIMYFHDLVCENTTYIMGSPNRYNISGVLVDGQATCQGYAKTFNLLCELAGYNAIELSGISENGSHMWSVVEINGEWYNFDATWDDSGDVTHHGYFAKPDELMKVTHTVRPTYKEWVPERSNNIKYWYVWRENCIIPADVNGSELALFIAKRMATEYKQGQYSVTFVTDNGVSKQTEISKCIKEVIKILQGNGYKMSEWYHLRYLSGGTAVITMEGIQ